MDYYNSYEPPQRQKMKKSVIFGILAGVLFFLLLLWDTVCSLQYSKIFNPWDWINEILVILSYIALVVGMILPQFRASAGLAIGAAAAYVLPAVINMVISIFQARGVPTTYILIYLITEIIGLAPIILLTVTLISICRDSPAAKRIWYLPAAIVAAVAIANFIIYEKRFDVITAITLIVRIAAYVLGGLKCKFICDELEQGVRQWKRPASCQGQQYQQPYQGQQYQQPYQGQQYQQSCQGQQYQQPYQGQQYQQPYQGQQYQQPYQGQQYQQPYQGQQYQQPCQGQPYQQPYQGQQYQQPYQGQQYQQPYQGQQDLKPDDQEPQDPKPDDQEPQDPQ